VKISVCCVPSSRLDRAFVLHTISMAHQVIVEEINDSNLSVKAARKGCV
jgi:hypothetical protein